MPTPVPVWKPVPIWQNDTERLIQRVLKQQARSREEALESCRRTGAAQEKAGESARSTSARVLRYAAAGSAAKRKAAHDAD